MGFSEPEWCMDPPKTHTGPTADPYRGARTAWSDGPVGIPLVRSENRQPRISVHRHVTYGPIALGHNQGVAGQMITAKRSSHVPCMHMPLTKGYTAVLTDGQGTEPRPITQDHAPVCAFDSPQMVFSGAEKSLN